VAEPEPEHLRHSFPSPLTYHGIYSDKPDEFWTWLEMSNIDGLMYVENDDAFEFFLIKPNSIHARLEGEFWTMSFIL
jgi:hypothetical protein